ncbi:copper chaperone [Mycoemilia scoparia]|uniref:Copper chaperone n=1 Tax=Mycoemilia scoparia TaxID=417184 RepID=A0A9W8AAB3_9FUNG|nr:copper chaperone [Mycoemilia scoparia]
MCIRSFNVSLEDQQVIVEGNARPSQIKRALEDSGRSVILRGAGSSNGENLGAAVCIFEYTNNDNNSPHKTQSQGLARIVQVQESLCFIDVTVSGLTPGDYKLGIHTNGDMTDIPVSCGKLFKRAFAGTLSLPKEDDSAGEKPLGDLGTFTVGKSGWGDLVVESSKVKVWDIIGRSMLISSLSTSAPEFHIGGIIARSAGLFENDKQVCACSGATMWAESRTARKEGRS